jgi:hypothetical protein
MTFILILLCVFSTPATTRAKRTQVQRLAEMRYNEKEEDCSQAMLGPGAISYNRK